MLAGQQQAYKYNLMRSPKGEKFNDKKSKGGNSQFTRAKLEEEYKPKVRFFKHNIMSMIDIPDEEKYQNKAKEEVQICNKAINKLKEGFSIKIDWNTRTNFRTTKSILPKIKTETSQPYLSVGQIRSKRLKTTNQIEKKRVQLSKLLFQRHKKKYMITKKQQEEEIKLFGVNSTTRHTSNPHSIAFKNPQDYHNFSQTRKLKTPKADKNIVDVQQQILTNSKLTVLKDELKSKFYQIRESFAKKQKFKKHLFLSLHQDQKSHQLI